MNRIIHRMRQKPDHQRKRIALMLSGGTTLLLFAIWAVTLPARIDGFSKAQPAAVSASTPINAIRQNVSNSYETLKNDLNANSPESMNSGGPAYVSNGVVVSDPNATTSGSYLDEFSY
jgi:hypothetical protein